MSVALASLFTPVRNGVQVAVRLIPKAAKDAIEGVIERAGGGFALKARVRSAPENGKANTALLRLLARAWGLPAAQLAIVAGKSDRNKILHIDGDPDALLAHLRAWLLAHEEK